MKQTYNFHAIGDNHCGYLDMGYFETAANAKHEILSDPRTRSHGGQIQEKKDGVVVRSIDVGGVS